MEGRMTNLTQLACAALGVPKSAVDSGSAKSPTVFARHLAMWLHREVGKESYPVIGSRFGMNHSAAQYGCRMVNNWIEIGDRKGKTALELKNKMKGTQ